MSAPRDFGATVTGSVQAADHQFGLVLADRFRVEGLLGMGGMGVVYRAHDLHLDVPVALKMLRPELASHAEAFERFRQELLLARQVSSPHVVRIHDIAQHEGRWLISMDLIEGQSLEKIIDRRGALPVEEVVTLLRQVAEGLDAAHRGGVVHRDLKPANVLVDGEGHAYISDFGVARSLGATGLTHSGSVVGTPEYLSPEQARAEPADQRSDLYSLGLIAYEMLTGKLPFSGGTPAESALQRIVRAPPPVGRERADIPAWLARIVDQLLRPVPAHRLQSARQLMEALDARASRRPIGSAGWWTAAAVLLVLAGAAWLLPLPAPLAPVQPPTQAVLTSPRWAVLPITAEMPAEPGLGAAQPIDEDLLAGTTQQLRQQLRERHPTVLDAERTRQALAVLGADGTANMPAPERLHESLHAATVVAGRWVAGDDGRAHFAFDVHRAGTGSQRVRGESFAIDRLAEAYGSAAQALQQALGVPARAPTAALPDARALAAIGAGLRAQSRGAPTEAVAAFSEATVLAPRHAPAWLSLAESARAAGRTDAALTAAVNGLRLLRDAAPGTPAAAHALRLQALRASLEGDPEAAATALRQLLQQRPGDAQAILLLAEAEADAGQFREATERLEQLVAVDPDDPRAWFLLGKVSILRGEARRAVDDYLVRALVLFNRSRNAAGQADTINALGVGYDRLGQVDQAVEQYRRAVELRRTLDDPRGLASSLRNLAALAAVRGEFELAETHLAEARTLLEALRDRQGLADLANDMGLLAEERGDFATALGHYREALQQRQAIGHAQGVAESLNNIGFGHYQLGAYDDAQVYWRQALGSFEALGDLSGMVRSRQNLAALMLVQGRWDDAAEALQATLAQAQREQMVEEAAVSQRYLAELALLRGDAAAAATHLERARTLFASREDQRGLFDVGLLSARLALLQGRHADAIAWLDGSRAELENLQPGQQAELLLLATEAALRGSEPRRAAALAVEAMAAAARSGSPLHALHARVLAAAATDRGGLEAIDAALAEAERMDHVPLLLRAHEIALQQAARTPGEAAQAVARYRRVQALLRRVGEYAFATQLHRAAADMLAAHGEPQLADDARDAAYKAREGGFVDQ